MRRIAEALYNSLLEATENLEIPVETEVYKAFPVITVDDLESLGQGVSKQFYLHAKRRGQMIVIPWGSWSVRNN